MHHITIQSTDTNASLEIERLDFEGFTNYAFTASLRGELVKNESVVLTGISEFLQTLRTFERTRSGAARLDGTEGCWLEVEADGQMGHAWLNFQVKRTLYTFSPQTHRGRSGHIVLSGSFPISGEFVAQLVQDLSRMLEEPPPLKASPRERSEPT